MCTCYKEAIESYYHQYRSAMALLRNDIIIKCLALIFLVFMSFCNEGLSLGNEHGILKPVNTPFRMGVKEIKYRRALVVDAAAALYDYDDAGANTKHEPRKGKPGSGGNRNT